MTWNYSWIVIFLDGEVVQIDGDRMDVSASGVSFHRGDYVALYVPKHVIKRAAIMSQATGEEGVRVLREAGPKSELAWVRDAMAGPED